MTEHLFAMPQPTPEAAPAPPRQRTLEDLGTPLHEVTFVVFDIETTGGKAADGGITEIGAVKLKGGECLGTYQTLVNPGRGIGKWQTYDIIFRRPHFNEDGSVKKPATVTVLLNGIVVQDNQELMGRATHKTRTEYKAHADKLPLTLQNHGQTVHYRNIWVRELEPRDD